MRRERERMDEKEALAFLTEAPVVHVASTTADGRPLLRTVHGVVADGMLCFHGAPGGEKTEALGREAVLACEEIVAVVPSYFVDPRRACPATTYYQSVQVHGALAPVDDPDRKARVLQALMDKYQPEGGYEPITAAHPLYRAAVAGLLVVGVPLDRLDGKAKLGQNRKPEELVRILEGLWRRGAPGDARAIEVVRRANPSVPAPEFLRGPDGLSLHGWLPRSEAAAAAAMLEAGYWNQGLDARRLANAQTGSGAWVGARDPEGRLVATARAITDGAKWAWVYDVMVAPAWQGRGLGRALLRLLLDHPALRGAANVCLSTRDAQGVYTPLGFRERGALPPRPYPSTEMILQR